jgi:hypothetical protein
LLRTKHSALVYRINLRDTGAVEVVAVGNQVTV